MQDYLHIGYDNVNGDIPTLIVARKTKELGQRISNTEVLKQFSGETAIDVYKLLTEIKNK
jgi:hypothetical protein